MQPANRPVSHIGAIGFALAGFTFWVFTDIGMKLAVEAGLPSYELMGLMGLSSGVAIILWAIAKKDIKKLRPGNITHQAFCASCSAVCTICNAVALRHLSLTLFYILVFTAPMVIALLASIFLHEKLSLGKIIAIVNGFLGVIVAINPFGNTGSGDWMGYIMCTMSVMAYASWTIRMRRMTQSESLESIALFAGVSLTVLGFIWTLLDFHPTTFFGIGAGIVSGLLNLCGNVCSFKALKHTTAANVSQIHYTQIIVGAVMAYFIWNDIPTGHLIVGSIIIIASGLYMAARAGKTGATTEFTGQKIEVQDAP